MKEVTLITVMHMVEFFKAQKLRMNIEDRMISQTKVDRI